MKDAETAEIADPRTDMSAAPVVKGVDVGLELVSWATTKGPTELAAALADYSGVPVPAPAGVVAAWSAHGLRIVSVPLSDLNDLRARLGVQGATSRQWLGQAGHWTEVVHGPEWPRGQTVALDAERLRLGPGRLRLLTRCWITPVPPSNPAETRAAEAGLTVEVLPQHQETASGDVGFEGLDRWLGAEGGRQERGPEAEGLLFRRLLVQLTVDARDERAFVILAERPGVDWEELASRPEPEAAEGEDSAEPASPATGQVVRGSQTQNAAPKLLSEAPEIVNLSVSAGPAAPMVPTLGEAMLGLSAPPATRDEDGRAQRRSHPARAIVVLIPRVPAEYRLLPRGG